MKKYKRNCPMCNEEIIYSEECYKNRAEKYSKRCRTCANKDQLAWNKGLTKEMDNRIKKYVIY